MLEKDLHCCQTRKNYTNEPRQLRPEIAISTMRIAEIKIKQFSGFEHKSFSFDNHMNVDARKVTNLDKM